MMKKRYRGNATIEMAVIFPIIMLALIFFVNIGAKVFALTAERYRIIDQNNIKWQEDIPGTGKVR